MPVFNIIDDDSANEMFDFIAYEITVYSDWPSESVALDLNPRPTRIVLALVSNGEGSKSSCLSYRSASNSLRGNNGAKLNIDSGATDGRIHFQVYDEWYWSLDHFLDERLQYNLEISYTN